ncbi:MAG: LPS export ABC transporter periplasmic protein LptC [Pseudomonadota bacterium]
MSPWRKLLALWDRVALYLPLLMMGALALTTYWLVRNTPAPVAPEGPRSESHEVDYFMRRATVKTFDPAGRLKSELTGSEARHYPDTQTLEVDQVRVRSVGPDGRVTTSTAKRGLTNDSGSEVQLMGDAVVVREAWNKADGTPLPRLEFRGEFLHVFVNEERVKSHLPVVLIRGNDRFTGDQFSYDHLDQVAELRGRVRGVFMPDATRAQVPSVR